MKDILKFIGALIGCILIILVVHIARNIGTTSADLEKEARSAQSISSDFQVCKDETDVMVSMLFYDENSDNHIFSVYVTRNHPILGYFYRAGGSLGGALDEILEFSINGYNEHIFMSMNKKQVSKITINDGNTIKTIEVNSTKPFTLILPIENSSVTIYDVNNNILDRTLQQL